MTNILVERQDFNPDDRAAAWVYRRYRVAPRFASLIAALAGLGRAVLS